MAQEALNFLHPGRFSAVVHIVQKSPKLNSEFGQAAIHDNPAAAAAILATPQKGKRRNNPEDHLKPAFGFMTG